jgi:hypothetical protein
MTTTVRDLLDRLHEQAWTLAGADPDDATDGSAPATIRRSWTRLARHTTRALQHLPFAAESPYRHYARVIIDTLEPLREDPGLPGSRHHQPLVQLSRTLGAIADLTAPHMHVVDDDGATGLQASILAAVYCAARWSTPRMDIPPKNRPSRAAFALRKLMALAEPFAALPPGQRNPNLEDLYAAQTSEPGLDAALIRWRHVVDEQLAGRYTLTANAFQTIAADCAILTAAAIVSLRHAGPAALAIPEHHQPALAALGDAHTSWTGLSTWPEGLFLGGRTSKDLRAASTNLRAEVSALLRTNNGWADAEQLWERTTPADLLAQTRRSIATVAGIASAYSNALTDHTIGRERPWIRATMVPAAHRNGFANQAAARDGWTPIPETMTAGIHAQLAIDGFAACQNARAARDALQAANGPESHSAPRSISIQSGRLTLLESAGWEHVSPRPALDARRSLVDVPVASFPSRSIGRP